mgnify:CR=1 FL=1
MPDGAGATGTIDYNPVAMTTFEEELRATAHPLIDGHTHIDQWDAPELETLLQRAGRANVGLIIAAGTTVSSCENGLALAAKHPFVKAGIGLHPADLEGPLDERTSAHLRELALDSEVVEWSECGLDYMPHSPDKPVQHDALRIQIRIARELGLPLVTHSREADDDILRILAEEHAGDVGGAWHYFGSSLDLAKRAMDLGFLISLAKPLLREEPLQQVAAQLGRVNDPVTAGRLALLRGHGMAGWIDAGRARDAAEMLGAPPALLDALQPFKEAQFSGADTNGHTRLDLRLTLLNPEANSLFALLSLAGQLAELGKVTPPGSVAGPE